MANAPLKDRTAQFIGLICPTREAEYFCKGDWTGQITLIRLRKLASARMPLEASNTVSGRIDAFSNDARSGV
jgi:hypothetical protein